ncbi:MAG: [FeFe] hydrogenase H-cluster radical SAM maturase HydG, partial [Armatimonadota bacterium]
LPVDGFRALKDAGIGTYQCFQETYHPDQYSYLHPSGRKADYQWRLGCMDRAFEGGIDDVGMGVLFGLYDHRFDVLALLAHAAYLDERYGIGPHTLSFPRIEPAQNAPAAEAPPAPVSDDDVRFIVAVLRLAVPYTGIIMSTRETAEMRRELFGLGVSQLSAGSRTYPGAYSDGRAHVEEAEQFALGDTRSLDLVVRDLCENRYLPSFCTSCYRLGRTGKDFMDIAKPGLIQRFCTPNALLTFQEYLLDYASPDTRAVGERLTAQLLGQVAPALRAKVKERLAAIRAGERDLYQ